MTSRKHGLAAKYSLKMAASEVASFETNFFRIAGTSEAATSVSEKAECLLFYFSIYAIYLQLEHLHSLQY